MRVLVCALLVGWAIGASAPGVQSVYVLPMAGGLDQYLANRLTGAGLFRVVTDPKLADAVFTEQLGSAFEQKLMELYTPPDTEKAEGEQKPPARVSSFGRSKGTIFLVDLKSRAVIWSAYQKRSRSTPDVLDRTAIHIVQQIKKLQGTK